MASGYALLYGDRSRSAPLGSPEAAFPVFLLSCSGVGVLTVTDTSTGISQVFPTMESVVTAHVDHVQECAWADNGSARDYYFYDFPWGQAMESVTVPVGECKTMLTIAKPAHRA